MILPYVGAYASMHRPHNRVTWYGGDCPDTYESFQQSLSLNQESAAHSVGGEWQYCFNEQGYRGDVFSEEADFTVAVVGCSLSFGVGVHWEQTWGYQLTQLIGTHLGLSRTICVNLSQSGASNDYIARTLLRQFEVKQPNLAVVLFTHMVRRELVTHNSILDFGAWNASENSLFTALLECFPREEAAANAIKNAMLVSYYCRVKNIPLVYSMVDRPLLEQTLVPAIEPLQDLWNAFDKTGLTPFSIRWTDVGRDNRHPGPKSHRSFADEIFEFVRHRELLRSRHG